MNVMFYDNIFPSLQQHSSQSSDPHSVIAWLNENAVPTKHMSSQSLPNAEVSNHNEISLAIVLPPADLA